MLGVLWRVVGNGRPQATYIASQLASQLASVASRVASRVARVGYHLTYIGKRRYISENPQKVKKVRNK